MELGNLWYIFIRSIATLIVLFLLVKLMGKKQISQLNLYDYMIGISIGSVAADISLDINKPLIDGLFSMTIYGLSAAFISYITTKSIVLRRLFTGVPTILIEKGKLIESGLNKVKFDINDLLEEARTRGYYHLDEIEYAIMEANGKVSFLPKKEHQPVTNKDMKIKVQEDGLSANLIIDGNLMTKNLKALGKDEKWLKQILKVKGYDSYQNILLLTMDHQEKITIYEKGLHAQNSTVLE